MRSSPVKRWLSIGLTAVVFASVLAILAVKGHSPVTPAAKGDEKPSPEHTWSLFGGSIQRNMVNTQESGIATAWDVDNKEHVKWVVDLGSKAYGGPIVADGKIFIGTNNENPRDPAITGDKGVLMCFRENDGKFLWQAVHDKLPAGRVWDWPREGICSSPVVEGKRLYYVSNRCEVECADTEGDGKGHAKLLWHLDMIKDLNVYPHNLADCSPLIVGDLLFVVTSNGVDEGHINIPSPDAPSFLAIDKNTGKVLWKSNAPGRRIMHGQWSNPVYAEVQGKPQVIFPGGDGYLYAFEPRSGEVIWKFDCNPKDSVYKLGGKGTRSDFLGTPVINDNKVYIGVGQDPEHDEGVGHLWCIDMTKHGDVSPELVTDDSVFPPKTKPNPNSATVWHFGGTAGAKPGRNYVFGRTMSTCSIKDGLCYAAELAGYLHCLDARTGKEYWEHEMNAACWSSPYWVDGKIYQGNDDGKILIFKHGKEKDLIAEQDMGGKVRATPVAVNGVLFVMIENKLFAIK